MKFWRSTKADKSVPQKAEVIKKKKSAGREWFDAILFAVIAATLIRGLFIEAYAIPSGSMEKTLLVGDCLFVSKISYGARTPITPVAFPFAHHTLPIIGTKAYWDGIQLDYHRLPGLSSIKRQDVVVFNKPIEGTAPYFRPIDKRENLIKRCVAIAGDTLSIVNAQVFINGQPSENKLFGETTYLVHSDGTAFNAQTLHDLRIEFQQYTGTDDYIFTMSREQAALVKKWPIVKGISELNNKKGKYDSEIFPNNSRFAWNQDNMSSFIIPKQNWTVKLDSTTIPLYSKAISDYEGNKVTLINNNEISINGKKADSYTFKQNYYWMMGDNRHNSLDSRYWGLVPEDHIVGKALFVWFSYDSEGSVLNKIRWNRLFMAIK
ncbi:MAG: signal peptidase [Sphingobacteriales bacterium]|nr:signal peptidase [Sphingobacteriales bacterium]